MAADDVAGNQLQDSHHLRRRYEVDAHSILAAVVVVRPIPVGEEVGRRSRHVADLQNLHVVVALQSLRVVEVDGHIHEVALLDHHDAVHPAGCTDHSARTEHAAGQDMANGFVDEEPGKKVDFAMHTPAVQVRCRCHLNMRRRNLDLNYRHYRLYPSLVRLGTSDCTEHIQGCAAFAAVHSRLPDVVARQEWAGSWYILRVHVSVLPWHVPFYGSYDCGQSPWSKRSKYSSSPQSRSTIACNQTFPAE